MRAFRTVACLLIPALAITTLPALGLPALAEGAQLQGIVRGIDGRPASGYRVHLIAEDGRDLAQSTVDGTGVYSFSALGAGDYSLGLENRSGEIAAVVNSPIQLGTNQLARRDIKLLESDADTVNDVLASNTGLGRWWRESTTFAKIWTVLGLVGVVGIAAAALDDDEEDASPITP